MSESNSSHLNLSQEEEQRVDSIITSLEEIAHSNRYNTVYDLNYEVADDFYDNESTRRCYVEAAYRLKYTRTPSIVTFFVRSNPEEPEVRVFAIYPPTQL